jgi:hypothetical protein
MTPQDAYWGAKRVMSFSNEDIRAVVEQGQFSKPAATNYITKVLIARRNLIGKAWFSQVAPHEEFVVADGKLRFTDLGQKYWVLSASIYSYSWFSFDNQSGRKLPVAGVSSDAVRRLWQTYRQGCNRPLRVQKAGRHHGTLVIAQPNRLLLLSDQNAYTGPTIVPQSRRGSRAQGHNAHILCSEWVPRLEVISNELCTCVGSRKSIGWYRRI